MQLRRAARVLLVGAPGVGKGTQAERLLNRFPQLQSISTGDLLRHNVKSRTPLGIQVESVMKSGGLVADDLMLRLISNELQNRGWLARQTMTLSMAAVHSSHDAEHHLTSLRGQPSEDPAASFILDGYPRNAAQAHSLESIIPINLAVSLKTPFEVLLGRISGRWVHQPSGRVYNTSFNKPKVPGHDDITGEPLTKRPDDTEEVYRARYDQFQKANESLLEHYRQKGVLIEVEGMTSDEISPKLYAEFEKRFA
ncbi:Putative Adenylate kinase [[Torrubiella] hemipterigena]|uniref:GTP:AMP phosphotransferase, mitochondrial n=1 Tax=[Torrubiella] hemipterigena TaxID=1531966 RepID=A0A0A1TBD2_9HYPO|nr:Putative Adenylate kinase [[Torrubiella] hemipterigena]